MSNGHINQDTCLHDWRDSYYINSSATLSPSHECEKCGLRTHQKGERSIIPLHIPVPPDDD
jgi:hypothetical protein